MKIITWNLNFWQNWRKENKAEWKNNILSYLDNLEYDFLLLQEINADYLFGGSPILVRDFESFFQGFDTALLSINLTYKHPIYYQKLRIDEIGAKKNKEIIPWGNAIIANQKYPLETNCYEKQCQIKLTENNYCGRSILMLYDFSLPNGDKISLINFYSKLKPETNGDYPILEQGIDDIKKFVENNSHLTILAGDFNSDPKRDHKYRKFFTELNNIGFVNCTEDLDTTMVPEIGLKKQYPNDKIFINKPFNESAKCRLFEDTSLELSDHRPLECIIDI